MPKRPETLNLVQITLRHVMARRIQNLWVAYIVMKRIEDEKKVNEEYARKVNDMDRTDVDEIGQVELMYMDAHNEVDLQGTVNTLDFDFCCDCLNLARDRARTARKPPGYRDWQQHSHHSHAHRARGQGGGEARKEEVGSTSLQVCCHWQEDGERAGSALGGAQGAGGAAVCRLRAAQVCYSTILSENFTCILWLYRKGGKGGRFFNTFETTTGRHCFLGGCGEQWDAFEEGQISEFSIYGSGITNYFKFIKWCAWTFFLLAIIALPSLVLNIYGPNNSNSGLKELAKTTAGNLFPAIANATASDLHVPGCYGYEIYHINCSLNRYRLAQFYAYLDIAVSILIFCALMWLRYFERVEDEELNKNTGKSKLIVGLLKVLIRLLLYL